MLTSAFKAYLCPNVINFNAVDFSECRSEEVIRFFWRSVYFVIYSSDKWNEVY